MPQQDAGDDHARDSAAARPRCRRCRPRPGFRRRRAAAGRSACGRRTQQVSGTASEREIDQEVVAARSASRRSGRGPARRASASAPGRSIGRKRAAARQLRRLAALPEPGVGRGARSRPAARKLMRDAGDDLVAAMGDRGEAVHQRRARPRRRSPAKSPSQAEPVTGATAAAAKAPTSILPSSPMSKMPARSENRPARQARSSGVDEPDRRRRAATMSVEAIQSRVRHAAAAEPRRGAKQRCDRGAEHVLQRAGEQDDQALDDDDHVAA